jgi:hypothetical protein
MPTCISAPRVGVADKDSCLRNHNWFLKGLFYDPFAPNNDGEPPPDRHQFAKGSTAHHGTRRQVNLFFNSKGQSVVEQVTTTVGAYVLFPKSWAAPFFFGEWCDRVSSPGL